jgi:hypothetical protein
MDYNDFIVCLCRKMIIVQRKLPLITRHSVCRTKLGSLQFLQH